MDIGKLKAQLIRHEGFRNTAYLCTAGKLTLGYGRNIDDKGISKKEAMYLLNEDIKSCHTGLISIFKDQFEAFPDDIQQVLTNMRFQLGQKGFRSFKKMIFAFQYNDFPEAVKQMKDSAWYSQTPNRAKELIKMVEDCYCL